MTDIKDEEMMDDAAVVVMIDDEGNEHYCVQEVVIPVDGEEYAILVEVDEKFVSNDGEELVISEEAFEDDEDAECIVAKIIPGEDGEVEYDTECVTDEELEKVQAEYDKLFDEE